MTDDMTTRGSTAGSTTTTIDEASGDTTRGSARAADDTFAWTEPEPTATTDRGAQAREWLNQLQAMIENLASQAAPVVREIGAKAAELTAAAGEKAGPVAQKTADVTGEAGHKLAERARQLATELRRDQPPAQARASSEAAASPEPMGESTAEAGDEQAREDRPADAS